MLAVRRFPRRVLDSAGRKIIGKLVLVHKLPDIRRHLGAAAVGLGLILKFAATLEHVGHFLLFGLSVLDLPNIVEGRILGRRCQFHLQLGENKVDARARAEAIHTADASRIPGSTNTLSHRFAP